MRHSPRSGKSYSYVQPSKRAVKRIKAKLTARNFTPITSFSSCTAADQAALIIVTARKCLVVWGGAQRSDCVHIYTNATRWESVILDTQGVPTAWCMSVIDCSNYPTIAPWKRAHALTWRILESRAWFDEGGRVKLSMKRLLKHHQTKEAETDGPFLQMTKPALYSYFFYESSMKQW